MPTPVFRVCGSILVALITSPTLAGCASSPTEKRVRAQFVGQDEYQARYRAVVRTFPEKMPPGSTFPPFAPPIEPGSTIQLSGGDAAAYFYWTCSWESIYLTAENDVEKSDAMVQLRRFRETSWAKDWVEGPTDGWDGILDAAQMGDTSGLGEFFQSDCGWYRAHPPRETAR
jgi:hypothetical protein